MLSTIHLGGLVVTAMLLSAVARLSACDQAATIASERKVPERTAPERAAAVAMPADRGMPLRSPMIDGIAPVPFLAENAWDFNAPATIPGFGPITAQEVEQALRHSR
jgi:hypothetical protein